MIKLHDADDWDEIIKKIDAAKEFMRLIENSEKPAKNNLTKWIIGMSDEALENVIGAGTQRTCLACPAKGLCDEMDGSCAGAFRRWAMEASE